MKAKEKQAKGTKGGGEKRGKETKKKKKKKKETGRERNRVGYLRYPI